MADKSFSEVLRSTFLRLGIPAVCSIAAVPLLRVFSMSPLIIIVTVFLFVLYAVYFWFTYRRPVVRSEYPSAVAGARYPMDISNRLRYKRNIFNHDLNDISKRIFDVVMSATLIVTLFPALVVLSIIVASQGKPVLIRHRRVGRGGQIFSCLKFRTMAVDADAILHRHLEAYPTARAEWEQLHKLSNDPRVTTVGQLLRKSSLDELPQLINVLRGEMSLVGPRPIVPAETIYYGDNIGRYIQVRPGLTGAWQIQVHNKVRQSTTYAYRVAVDVKYAQEHNLLRDITILFKAVPAIMQNRVEYLGEEALEDMDTFRIA